MVGEPIVGEPQPIEGDDLRSFVGLPVPVFTVIPVATQLAETLHAYTLPRPRPSSRVKDLPDIALLATVAELDASDLRSAIQQAFARRATHGIPPSLPAPSPTWEPVYARMAAADGLPWCALAELTEAVQAFLDPVLAGEGATWDARGWRWKPGRDCTQPRCGDLGSNRILGESP